MVAHVCNPGTWRRRQENQSLLKVRQGYTVRPGLRQKRRDRTEGEGSVSSVLASQAFQPELHPPEPTEKSGSTYLQSQLWEVETGGPLELNGQPAYLNLPELPIFSK